MENKNVELDDLVTDLKDYLETRSELGKLKAIDKGSRITAEVISVLLIAGIGLLGLLFLSIAGAFALGKALDNTFIGFLLISFFYLLVSLLLFTNRNSWIQKPIINRLIKNFFKDHGKEDL